MNERPCPTCGELIVHVTTAAGKRLRVNAAPSPAGLVEVIPRGKRSPLAVLHASPGPEGGDCHELHTHRRTRT